ncbi:MAG: aspartate-semialdehyde dehydrogenase [Gammaproteobacteria bacterium]|nr:aspartate-semialdehyde dehydrogenase [Gammaproteobacteria bacterium]
MNAAATGTRKPLTVAVVGATGAVGHEFLAVLEQRNFPIGTLKLLASKRSAGQKLRFGGREQVIEEMTEQSFAGVDVAFFSAGGPISKSHGPIAAAAGAVVVDNSSAFRMDPKCPLVVPEVNPEAMAGIRLGQPGGAIIANPNCSTIIMLMAVNPIRQAAGVSRIVVSTYQAASGAGAAAMEELRSQTVDVLAGKPAQPKIFPQQYAFNIFSHNSAMQPDGYNQEEVKMVKESHRIWGDSAVGITATCVRVPVMRAHAESVNLTLKKPLGEAEALEVLKRAPGVTVIDDRGNNRFPTPLDASHKDDVLVGRVRTDHSQPGGVGLNLFVCGDQLRKGAALNAVQIAELLLR